ncbi:MAG: hypothetical protein HYR96_00110 [Deltaproteobacteria bacterium]|nr:hypothetical protein [Deltaproteobacteria bacterium]MBI3295952.1 hypothetical protein [Deltaproteobacteria bacterium]
MLPNDKFKFEQMLREQKKVIMLSGMIDEDTTFDEIMKLGSPLIFNFKGITAINSCGVRNWVNFLKAFGENNAAFEECPPTVVKQMNMIPSFTAGAKIASVYVPYVCDNCDAETMALIDVSKFSKGKFSVKETIPCEACKEGEMELDGHPAQYFSFIK